MEYYENDGQALASLYWSGAGQPEQVIPQAQLYPAAVASPGEGSYWQEEMAIRLYPNPATAWVTLVFTAARQQTVCVVVKDNFSGQVSRLTCRVQAGENTVPVNVSRFRAGLYLIDLSVDGKRLVKRLMIDK